MDKVKWTESNGVYLRYAEDGQGETTIVLIHELGGTLESWDYVLPSLTDRYRVLRYDMRGFGLSEKIFGTYTLDDAITDLEGFVAAMDISVPIVFVGAAVGAGVAMRFAAKHPAKAAALIALSPATELSQQGKEGAKSFSEFMKKIGMRRFVDDKLSSVFSQIPNTNPERLQRFCAQQASTDLVSYIATYKILAEGSFRPFLPDITCPTLVAAGKYDVVRPPEFVEPVAKLIPGVKFKVVESGHFMATQTPDLAIELILEGLNNAGR